MRMLLLVFCIKTPQIRLVTVEYLQMNNNEDGSRGLFALKHLIKGSGDASNLARRSNE